VIRPSALSCCVVVAASSLGVSCGGDENADDGRLVVAAAFFPIEELVRNVGGADVDVITVVPPGEEAHEYEPTPKQLTDLAEADIVFYFGNGFQPGVEDSLDALPNSVETVDLLDNLSLLPADGGDDPHVWLDPDNMHTMTAVVAAELASAAPDLAAGFAERAGASADELATLDADFSDGLAFCDSRVLVTGHDAFAYLAAAYDLDNVPIAGISPSEEPSAQALEDVAELARQLGVTTIFFEENLPDDLSRTVAAEVGADTAVLDPIESPSRDQLDDDASYVSLMRSNLAALRAGLGCR